MSPNHSKTKQSNRIPEADLRNPPASSVAAPLAPPAAPAKDPSKVPAKVQTPKPRAERPAPARAALQNFTPAQMIEGFGDKGPFTYNCQCPACSAQFTAGPFTIPPPPEQPMSCGMCNRGGIPFRAMREGFENKQRFFGDAIDCPRDQCPTLKKTNKRQRYQPIMEGPGGMDERTGKGGMRRACPACGFYVPTKKPTPNAAEDEKTDLSGILA
jgi:hypothetical protein